MTLQNLKQLCIKTLSIALCTFVAATAWSMEEEDTISIDSLLDMGLESLMDYEVIAPTKRRTRLADSPGTVSVITHEQIRNSAATTIPELLRQVPGIHVRWNPMAQSIEVRSFGSNPFTSRVLLLIDGVPYNSWNKGGFPQHPGFDFFNIRNVKHLEVIRGSGSALYGENALNGVINIVTFSGDEYRQTKASLFVGDRDVRAATITHGSKIGENGSIFVSARAEQGQLPMRIWTDADAKSKGQDLFLKAKYKDFQFTYYGRRDEFDGFDDPVVEPLNANFTSIAKVEQDINIAALKYSTESEDGKWSFQSNASYSERNGTHCGGCHAASQSSEFNNKIDHGYQLFGNVQIGMDIENHSILFGAEYRRNSAGDSFNQVTSPADPTDRVLSYSKIAYFIQDQISFPDQNLNVILGLRYDSATSPELLDKELFPRIAFVAKPIEDLTLRGGWSRAARYPTFVEFYQNTRFFAAEAPPPIGILFQTDFQPNGDLVAETMDSFELGAEYAFSKNFQAKVDLFRNTVDNPLVLVYSGGNVMMENHAADALVQGIETEVRFSGNRWSGYANWSYQDEEQRGQGVDSAGNGIEFSYAPSHKANMGLTYKTESALSATFEWSWRGSHLAPIFWSELAFGTPGAAMLDAYSYLNFRLRYRLPFDVGNDPQPITVSVFAKNLGNETPTETFIGGDGHLAEMTGREYFLGVNYDWTN